MVARFVFAGLLVAMGVRMSTSFMSFLVGWTIVSSAMVIVWSGLMQHAHHLSGVCIDCEEETVSLFERLSA